MNKVEIFRNEEFGEIRTLTIDGEPWFVGKDVAEVLGYKDTSDALKKHVDSDDKLSRRFTDSGQSRKMYVINESGLYSLILSSKLPNAKKFKHWVTSEVLPAIRKTGAYCLHRKSADITQNPCAYAEAKDKVALWKRSVSNPLIERLIFLTGAADFVAAYTCVYKLMRQTYGFDMNKAKFDYCQKYNIPYENCSVIDCIGDDSDLRSAFEQCVSRKIRELSEDRLEQVKRDADKKIRIAKDFAAHSDEIIQKAMRASQILNTSIETADNECNL